VDLLIKLVVRVLDVGSLMSSPMQRELRSLSKASPTGFTQEGLAPVVQVPVFFQVLQT